MKYNFFSIFENGKYAADHIFMSPIKKIGTAKFSLSKNHKDLKNQYLFLKIANTFLLLQLTIAKKKIQNEIFLIFLFSQKGQNGF